jgi:hypothetical protein
LHVCYLHVCRWVAVSNVGTVHVDAVCAKSYPYMQTLNARVRSFAHSRC